MQLEDHENNNDEYNPHQQAPKITNEFKRLEKKYKYYQNKKTDFKDLIDVTNPSLPPGVHPFEITDPSSGKVYKCFRFDDPEGLIIIKNYTEKKDK